jgi:hypothetical protein
MAAIYHQREFFEHALSGNVSPGAMHDEVYGPGSVQLVSRGSARAPVRMENEPYLHVPPIFLGGGYRYHGGFTPPFIHQKREQNRYSRRYHHHWGQDDRTGRYHRGGSRMERPERQPHHNPTIEGVDLRPGEFIRAVIEDAGQFMQDLAARARVWANILGTRGDCAHGPRLALNDLGFILHNGRKATQLAATLLKPEESPFKAIPLADFSGHPPVGGILVRNWTEKHAARDWWGNRGDMSVIGEETYTDRSEKKHTYLVSLSDHVGRRPISADGGYYRNSFVLVPKGYKGPKDA